MRTSCLVFAAAAMLLSAPLASAQRPQGGGGLGGGFFLLSQDSLQKELGLSEEQIKQVDEQLGKLRESFSGLRELSRDERREKLAEATQANRAALASVLDEEQLKRFNQISLQQSGGQAFANPRIANALGLSDEQKTRIGEIQSSARDEMRSLFQGAADGDRAEIRDKMQKARAAVNEKLLGVLTPEQQTKWKEMIGKPFTGEIRRRFRGGNRGGQGIRRRRNRDADNTEAARPLSKSAAGMFRLASFRSDDDGKQDESAKKPQAKGQKKQGAKGKKKRGADKAPAPKGKRRAGQARRRGRGDSASTGRPEFARRHRSQRDRAWDRVARMMRHRGHYAGRRSGRDSMAGRGPRHHFAHSRHPRPSHRGHGAHVAWGRRPSFGPRHHHAHFAGFHRHRGHRPTAFAFGHGHRGPLMAHHNRHSRRRDHSMARHGGFRGPHRPEMAHLPRHRHGYRHHGMHAGHHHGPRASFAGHRGKRPMHMAGVKGHGPHGRDMGKHGQQRGATGSRDRHHDRDRDDKDKRDRDADRAKKDRDDD